MKALEAQRHVVSLLLGNKGASRQIFLSLESRMAPPAKFHRNWPSCFHPGQVTENYRQTHIDRDRKNENNGWLEAIIKLASS